MYATCTLQFIDFGNQIFNKNVSVNLLTYSLSGVTLNLPSVNLGQSFLCPHRCEGVTSIMQMMLLIIIIQDSYRVKDIIEIWFRMICSDGSHRFAECGGDEVLGAVRKPMFKEWQGSVVDRNFPDCVIVFAMCNFKILFIQVDIGRGQRVEFGRSAS